MQVQVFLVDINTKMVQSWRETFEENPEVTIVEGSLLDQPVDAWVSPTNSRGVMDGGLDGVIKKFLGPAIEARVQQEILSRFGGVMPVGHATCVPTGRTKPAYLISTPTMITSSEDVSDTMNVALACAAAFQAIHQQNAREPDSIRSVALPGLGANTGRVPVAICADLIWSGYSLFRRQAFADFNAMRQALEAELGDLGPASTGKITGATPLTGQPAAPGFGQPTWQSPPTGNASGNASGNNSGNNASGSAAGAGSKSGNTVPPQPHKTEEVDFDDFDDFDDSDDSDDSDDDEES